MLKEKKMITIINNSINGVTLGVPIALLDMANLKEQIDDYETEDINGSEVVVTLFINKTDKFSLNGKIIDSHTIESFLREENPLIDDTTYIFPKYNLLFNYDQKHGVFMMKALKS